MKKKGVPAKDSCDISVLCKKKGGEMLRLHHFSPRIFSSFPLPFSKKRIKGWGFLPL